MLKRVAAVCLGTSLIAVRVNAKPTMSYRDSDSFPAIDTKKWNAWVNEIPHPLRGRDYEKKPGLYEDYAVLVDTTGTPTPISYKHVIDLIVRLETPHNERDPPARIMMIVHYLGVDDMYGRDFVFDKNPSLHADFGQRVIKAKMALVDQNKKDDHFRKMVHWENIWRNYWIVEWEGRADDLTKFNLQYLADEPFSRSWSDAWLR